MLVPPMKKKHSTLIGFLFLLVLATAVQAGTLPSVRSIRITNTLADWFYLEELEILNEEGDDVASLEFGTTVEGSEDPAFGGVLDGVIDDVFGPCCATGFHSSSSLGNQTITLTFTEPQTITGQITVWDREEACCSHRLDGMLWEYFDGPGATGEIVGEQQVNDLALESQGDINLETGASFEVANPRSDSDGDGLPDQYEAANGLDPGSAEGVNGAEGDLDGDLSPNIEEFERKTDPQNKDSDEDGVIDGEETNTGLWEGPDRRGTDPLNPDSDGDGLSDLVETNTGDFADSMDTGTDPNQQDTDGDSFRDNREIFFGTDPNADDSVPVISTALSGVRSIRVTNVREDWFYMEELQIFNSADIDVASEALGTTATASEFPGFGGKAEGIIDDLRGPCCGTGFHSSTDMGSQTLILTFAEAQDLSGVVTVWDREDGCCRQRLDGMLFEFFDGEEAEGTVLHSQLVELLAADNLETIGTAEGASFQIQPSILKEPIELTGLTYDRPAGSLALHWSSNPGEFFNVERSLSLERDSWELLANRMPAMEAEESSFVVENLTSERKAFYRIVRASAPPLLEEGFEGEVTGWTTGEGTVPFPNGAATRWEVGVPTSGPGEARTGQNVYGTGLDSDYEDLANLTLRSPLIDLTGKLSAELSFWYFMEAGDQEGGVVEFLDGDDPTVILTQTGLLPSTPGGWEERVFDLKKAGENGELSLLGSRFYVQFHFLSDDRSADNGAGLFIDDVVVDD